MLENRFRPLWGMPSLIELSEPEDQFRLCRQLGLDFVELNMDLPAFQADRLGRLAALSEKYGVEMTLHLSELFNPANANPTVADAWMRSLRETIRAARLAGVKAVNMHLNKGVYFTLPTGKQYLFDRFRSEYLARIREMREMCEQEIGEGDLRICVENTDGFEPFQFQALGILLESYAFGLTWDIGHSHTAKSDDLPFLLAHSERLSHFHIHDALAHQCHLPLGEGEIDLHKPLSMAAKVCGRCVIEIKIAAALEKSVQWLHEHGWIRE